MQVSYSVFILIALFLFSCKEKKKAKDLDKIASDTQRIASIAVPELKEISRVDSICYRSFIDSAEWLAYCIHADDSTSWTTEHQNLPVYAFASLNWKYQKSVEKGDSIEIFFKFYLKDLACDYRSHKNYHRILNGIAFNKNTGKKLYLIRGDAIFREIVSSSRYKYELQPDVVSFLKTNRNILAPWFKNEAKRRGII